MHSALFICPSTLEIDMSIVRGSQRKNQSQRDRKNQRPGKNRGKRDNSKLATTKRVAPLDARAEAAAKTQPTKTDKAAMLARIKELLPKLNGPRYVALSKSIKHPNETLEAALKLSQASYSFIPVETDGSKEAKKGMLWKPYQKRFPTTDEVLEWFDSPNPYGIGIIHGSISGGSEVVDVDDPALVEPFEKRLEEVAPGLLSKLIIVRTPRPGRHYYYTLDHSDFLHYDEKRGDDQEPAKRGNQKLARRRVGIADADLPRKDDGSIDEEVIQKDGKIHKDEKGYFRIKDLIETRGEGGYTIPPGSPAKTHPTGKAYELIQGSLDFEGTRDIRITLDERATLLEVAHSFNEYVDPKNVISAPRKAKREDGDLRPGEAFDQSPEAPGIARKTLIRHGWSYLHNTQVGERWQRPDGDRPSATLFDDSGILYVFSSNAHPFKPDMYYSPFAVLTYLEHGGNFSACAKALYADGYGERAQGNGNGFRPSRFHVDETGVYVKKDEQDGEEGKGLWLCSPLYVRAWTRDENRENAGLRLEWLDRDGNVRYWTMPRDLAVGDATAIQKELLYREFGSFAQWRGANAKFIEYLQTANPEKVVRNTSRIGWHNGAYILPDETIGASNGEETVLQSNAEGYRLTVNGTLEEWQSNVARYCEGNSRLLFAASVAFAAPLLRPLGQEGGGFHFRGQSSKGKSTTTIVAGSIYGGGDSTLGYARTWSHTANALEATAEMHNDGLLILDELARCDAKDAGNVAYMLASGDGKGRLQSSIRMRKPFKWQLMFLSTGELSLHDHAATSGKKTRAGQEVRLCDLPADTGVYGVFENLHGFADGSKFAQALQRNARAYYGAPLRAYLTKLTQDDLNDIKRKYLEFERQFTEVATEAAKEMAQAVSGEVSRVASRFALVAFAGDLATAYGVTGWTKNAALQAAFDMFKEWIANRGGTGNADEEAAVSQVRRFLAEYGSTRFETNNPDHRIIGKRAGWIEEGEIEGENVFCIFPDTFCAEVCSGYDARMVAEALYKRGFLDKDADGKRSLRKREPDGTRHRVYVIKSDIFAQ